jgi:hypothetical protein
VAAGPHRGAGQLDEFLGDELGRVGLDTRRQGVELVFGQPVAEQHLAGAPGKVGLSTRLRRLSSTSARAGASPHHQVATEGMASSSPSRWRQMPGRKPGSAADSSRPEPSALATSTLPARTAPSRPGTPRAESARSSTGSQKSSSRRRRMHALEAGDGLEEDGVVAHREVLPSTSGKPR